MIHAELKLRIPRDHCVVILPNESTLAPIVRSSRSLEALRIGDIVEDCELVDKVTGDRFGIPAGVAYRFNQLEVEPPANSRAMRVYTLVRVG